MDALVYLPSYELELRAEPVPRPGPDEVIVRVEAAGICGSDVHGVLSRSPRRTPPLIMGHELSGTVVGAGGNGGEPLIGARVAVNPQLPCGDCSACRSGRENVCSRRGLIGGTRPGGFAELVSVPLRCIHVVSAELRSDAAVFCEPLATCVHALHLVPGALAETVVVLGAGSIGVLATQLLRVAGARTIIVSEVDEDRRQSIGATADAAVTPDDLYVTVMDLTEGAGVSLSVDAVGTAGTRHESIRVLQPAGTALWLGMHEQGATIPGFDLVVREQTIRGSFAYTNPEFAQALGLLERGLIDPAVSVRSIPLEASGDVFRQLLDGRSDGFLKAIINPERSR